VDTVDAVASVVTEAAMLAEAVVVEHATMEPVVVAMHVVASDVQHAALEDMVVTLVELLL
jgi:hypothetical protein